MRALPRRRCGPDHVVDGVHRLRLGFVSAYLVESDAGLTLIDCGERGRGDAVAGAARHLGGALDAVGDILVTHHHPDHRGSLADLARRTGARVHVHGADAPYVRGDTTWSGFDRGTLPGRLLAPLQPRPPEGFPVDREVRDGDHLDIAGGIDVLHTPGHTPGHTAYLLARAGGVLVTGDAATNVGRLRCGSHRLGAMVTDDRAQAAASFDRLARLEFEVAVFGHGAPILANAAERFRAITSTRTHPAGRA